MLYSLNTLKGFALHTKDGQLGKLDEIYFDDGCWWIRYLVVNVGSWLNRQQVLLVPDIVLGIDPDLKMIEVDLTKKQVEESPDALEVTPVSRAREVALHRHYDWIPYWELDPLGTAGYGRVPNTIVRPGNEVRANVDVANDATAFADPKVRERAEEQEPELDALDDSGLSILSPSGRLQSSKDVQGYHIHAKDGEIGHLDDFLIDRELKAINYLIVDTRDWLPGKKVVVLPHFVHRIVWDDSKIEVLLTKEQISCAPEYSEKEGLKSS